MTLDAYLSSTGLTNAEFATRVGVDTTTISRVRKGRVNPSAGLMRAIFLKSEEAVSPNDFVLAPADPAQPAPEPTREVA